MKKLKSSKQSINALILTPSRELCAQALRNLNELTPFCQRELTCVDLSSSSSSGQVALQSERQILATKPDIVIATPTKILNHLRQNANSARQPLTAPVDLKTSLELLVIDEADLLLSFGYEDDMKELIK
jgi:ATP-dependent RNA helicase DDX56/DBP9